MSSDVLDLGAADQIALLEGMDGTQTDGCPSCLSEALAATPVRRSRTGRNPSTGDRIVIRGLGAVPRARGNSFPGSLGGTEVMGFGDLGEFGDVLDDIGLCDVLSGPGCDLVRGLLTQMKVPLSTAGIRAKIEQMGKDKFCAKVVELAPEPKGIAAAACSTLIRKIMGDVAGEGAPTGPGGCPPGTVPVGSTGKCIRSGLIGPSARGIKGERDITTTQAGYACSGAELRCQIIAASGPAVGQPGATIGEQLPMSRCASLKNPDDLRAGVPDPRPLSPPDCAARAAKPKISTGIKIGIGAGVIGAGLLILPRLLGR